MKPIVAASRTRLSNNSGRAHLRMLRICRATAMRLEICGQRAVRARVDLVSVQSERGSTMRRHASALATILTATFAASSIGFAYEADPLTTLFQFEPMNQTGDGHPQAEAIPREVVMYQARYAPGTIVISTGESGSSMSWATAKPFVTAWASAGRASNGRDQDPSRIKGNGRIGRRRLKCCAAVPTSPATWRAA